MNETPSSGSAGEGSAPRQGGAATQRSVFARAEQVYFEVAGLSASDRAEAVKRLCGMDEALERQVQDLLRSAARLGAFIEQPLLGKQFDELSEDSRRYIDAPDELLGATLGAFKVDSRIASGGMGTVYRAHRSDHQYEQTVAIKVVKRGMDSEEILRRFGEERQTLANLNHPSIARLLDAGVTPDGRPYLVMEHIDGLPIDQYCDRKRLGIRDRLKLFQLVCDAVHTAHQSLVIHRDLKPSNILVTDAGVPKLLDFGIAKVLAPSTDSADPGAPATAETERRLTPEYASPEQVQGGPITTGSDVYSLGMILYELLTGVRPYAFALRSTDEVRRVVCSVIPPMPSSAVTRRAVPTRQTASRVVAAVATQKSALPAPSEQPGIATGESPPDHPRTRGVQFDAPAGSTARRRRQHRADGSAKGASAAVCLCGADVG